MNHGTRPRAMETFSGNFPAELMKPHQRNKIDITPLPGLTVRQTQVLQRIANSRTTKQIALELNISAKTVEAHRRQLMETLEIYDIPGLVRFAIKAGLVSAED